MSTLKAEELNIRHQRQQLIPGWRQERLSLATVGVVGSDPWPSSFFLTAAAALGIRRLVIICPRLQAPFDTLARDLDPGIEVAHLEGWLTHPATAALLDGCSVLVDFSQLGLTNKILFNAARERCKPLVTIRCLTETTHAGFRFLSVEPGQETAAIRSLVSRHSVTAVPWNDPVTAMVAAGLALEEVKRILFDASQTPGVLEYVRPVPATPLEHLKIAVIGAGALGNFAAAALALSGCRHITVWDPDRVDVTNLNRQIFFARDVGAFKAPALAHRLNIFFGAQARGLPQPFDERTDISAFDAVLDCVDNFETRVLISRRVQEKGKILISGGTGPDKGQVVAYHPTYSSDPPARLLNMDSFIHQRRAPTPTAASCLVQADPSVVMSNLIIGAIMGDALRRMLSGEPPVLLFYESSEKHGLGLSASLQPSR